MLKTENRIMTAKRFAAAMLSVLVLAILFVVIKSTMPEPTGKIAENHDGDQSFPELEVCLPFSWFAATKTDGLALLIDKVKSVEQKDDGFDVTLEGIVTVAPSKDTYAIELHAIVANDGIGYYVADILSFYCNGHPEVHKDFEMVKRDCLAYMERKLVRP